MKRFRLFRFRLALLAAGLTLAGCGDSTTAPGADQRPAELRISANLSATTVDLLVVTVSAPDIPAPLVFNLPVDEAGMAEGTLRIPPGNERTILVEAFDISGVATHDGEVTIDVTPGPNPPITIPLRSKAGQVPVTVTFGSFTVDVSPPSVELGVGEGAQLTASIVSAEGGTIPGTVQWATTNPAVATVSPDGVVTGVIGGTAQIVATYEGVAGIANVTVSGGDAYTGAYAASGTINGDGDPAVRDFWYPLPSCGGFLCTFELFVSLEPDPFTHFLTMVFTEATFGIQGVISDGIFSASFSNEYTINDGQWLCNYDLTVDFSDPENVTGAEVIDCPGLGSANLSFTAVKQ